MPKVLYTEFVGIDVSKNKLDVYETKNNQHYTVANDKEGIGSLFGKIKRNEQQLVLIDLTSDYEAKPKLSKSSRLQCPWSARS